MLDTSLCGLVPGDLFGLGMDLFVLGMKGVVPENPLSLPPFHPGDSFYIQLETELKGL